MVDAGIISGKLSPAECIANMLLSGNPVYVRRGRAAIKAALPHVGLQAEVDAAIARMTKAAQ